jgi:3-hydroxyisobutyrate dehydrogenase
MSAIAVVGLGNMGGPMAANLVAAGHTVTGYDPVPDAADRGRAAGVTITASASDAVRAADVVITMLPSGAHVLDCYGGPGGRLVAAARPGTLFVDCSTIDVSSSRAAHELAGAAGHRSVDAPVSGGVVGATEATLTFMAGGDDQAVSDARPVLETMGRRVVACGGPGAGQAAKVCNNLVLGASMIAVSEAFVLGEALGLDHQAFFDVASTASGQCWALTTNCPVPGPVPGSPANRDYRPGFSAGLMLKDLGLAMDAASEHAVDTVLAGTAARLYEAHVAQDGPGRDFSAIIDDIRNRSGITA